MEPAPTDIADAIKNACEQGDLSENAEYQYGSRRAGAQRSAYFPNPGEHRPERRDHPPKGDGGNGAGSTVKLKSGTAKPREYQVVGTVEATPLSGKISDESPIGQAMIGKVGDAVEIKRRLQTSTPTRSSRFP